MFENDWYYGDVFDDLDVPASYRGTWESDRIAGIAYESNACGYVRESALHDAIAEYERCNDWN